MLAGRAEMIETPSVPSTAKITVIVPFIRLRPEKQGGLA
jgi:hypothetical protein